MIDHAALASSEAHGHELRDVDASRVVILLAGVAVSVMMALGICAILVLRFSARDRREQQTAIVSPLPLPSPPRLQTNPPLDLAAKRQAEDAILNSYGWVDRRAGTVHIPIDRAMQVIAGRGSLK
jgi:hypothetical protein